LTFTGILGKIPKSSGRSAAWLAHLHGVQVVGGSNPLVPTMDIQGTLNLVGVPFFVAFNFFPSPP
jgi:hypothetical protein